MGSFYRVIPPFSTKYTNHLYVFDDQTVHATNFAKILGFKYGSGNIPEKYMFLGRPKQIPLGNEVRLFIKVDDLPQILVYFRRNPEDLKKLINPDNLDQSLQNSRKRDREEEKDSDPADQNFSDDLIKLFAKRYIAENPEKVREVIVERLIGQNIAEFIKKL